MKQHLRITKEIHSIDAEASSVNIIDMHSCLIFHFHQTACHVIPLLSTPTENKNSIYYSYNFNGMKPQTSYYEFHICESY